MQIRIREAISLRTIRVYAHAAYGAELDIVSHATNRRISAQYLLPTTIAFFGWTKELKFGPRMCKGLIYWDNMVFIGGMSRGTSS